MASFERISVKNLTKSFKNADGGKNVIFENVSFELKSGAILRLSGASGSGKTTFMNVLSALIKPDSGAVFFGNTDITSLGEGGKDRFRAENIGYIFQTFNLLSPFSVIENVYAPLAFAGKLPENYKDKALDSLNKVGMKEFAAKKPYHLSVGQKQRVAAARVLFADPPLVFADEPLCLFDYCGFALCARGFFCVFFYTVFLAFFIDSTCCILDYTGNNKYYAYENVCSHKYICRNCICGFSG